jgi:hypothetical protein
MTFRQFQSLLMEANPEKRIQFLISAYSQKLKKIIDEYHFTHGGAYYPMLYPSQTGQEGTEEIIPKLIRYIVLNVDPQSGAYSEWVVKSLLKITQYVQLNRMAEDWGRVKEALITYHEYKSVIKSNPETQKYADINKVDGFNGLYTLVEDLGEAIDEEETRREQKAREKEVEKIYESSNFLILTPKTQEASCAYGRGTRWCTAATGSYNYFHSYNKNGPLYIIIDKQNTESKFQLQFQDDQYMDENDEPITLELFADDDYYKEICKPLAELADKNENALAAVLLDSSRLVKILDERDPKKIQELSDMSNGFKLLVQKAPELINGNNKYFSYDEKSKTFTLNTHFYDSDMAEKFVRESRWGAEIKTTQAYLEHDWDDYWQDDSYTEYDDSLWEWLTEDSEKLVCKYIEETYDVVIDSLSNQKNIDYCIKILKENDDETIFDALTRAYSVVEEMDKNDKNYKEAVETVTHPFYGDYSVNSNGYWVFENISLQSVISMLDTSEEHQGAYDMDDFMNMYAGVLDGTAELKIPDYDNSGYASKSDPDHKARFNEDFQDQF